MPADAYANAGMIRLLNGPIAGTPMLHWVGWGGMADMAEGRPPSAAGR